MYKKLKINSCKRKVSSGNAHGLLYILYDSDLNCTSESNRRSFEQGVIKVVVCSWVYSIESNSLFAEWCDVNFHHSSHVRALK